MLHTISILLVVAAFLGAGLFNAVGMAATQSGFVRWGYPRWWCHVTGGLEIAVAILVAVPITHEAGLVLGAIIIAAAALTVLRHRELFHLVPLALFAAVLALAGATSSMAGTFTAL